VKKAGRGQIKERFFEEAIYINTLSVMSNQPQWMAEDSQQQYAPPNGGSYRPPGPGLSNANKDNNNGLIKLGVKGLVIGASVMMVVHGKRDNKSHKLCYLALYCLHIREYRYFVGFESFRRQESPC
jgi:hypothetical protein